MRTVLAVAACALAALPGGTALAKWDPGSIGPYPGSTFQDIDYQSPPPSVRSEADHPNIRAFNEAVQKPLGTALGLDATAPFEAPEVRVYDTLGELHAANVPANVPVESQMLHFDPEASGGREKFGCISTYTDIFGFIQRDDGLDATDAAPSPTGLGANVPNGYASNTNYPNQQSQRGPEFGGEPLVDDERVVFPNERRICVKFETFDVMDELRVVSAGIESISLTGGPARPVDTSTACDILATVRTSSFTTTHSGTSYTAGNDPPNPGAVVRFNVISGPHAGQSYADVDGTDANGQSCFAFNGTSPGVDTIEAWVDVRDAQGNLNATRDPNEPITTATKTWDRRATAITSVSCTPTTPSIGSKTSCTATVTDVDPQGTKSAPGGFVQFGAAPGGVGSFVGGVTTCTLEPVSSIASECETPVEYSPSSATPNQHTISATYSGTPAKHSPSGPVGTTITVGGEIKVAKKIIGGTTPYWEETFDGNSVSDLDDLWNTSLATSGKRWCSSQEQNHHKVQGDWIAATSSASQCTNTFQAPPYGAINLNNGVGTFSAGPGRAFPYIWSGPPSRSSPFPPSGDFALEVGMEFQVPLQGNGTFFMARDWPDSTPTGDNRPGLSSVLAIRGGSTGVYVEFLDQAPIPIPEPQQLHDYRLEYVDGEYSLFVDDELKAGPTASALRPNALLTGNEVFTWWIGNTDWTDFNLDRVRVGVPIENYAQDFQFQPGGGLTHGSFSLDHDDDPALSNEKTLKDVPPGSNYNLQETVPTGWDLVADSCDQGNSISSISVASGELVTCTFTNQKRGRIVVEKNAQPDDPQDFNFNVSRETTAGKVAFSSTRSPGGPDHEIWTLDPQGSFGQLTNNSVDDQQPNWSPDGQRIAFTSASGGDLEIHVMDANGSNESPLTSNSTNDSEPDWSPDGSKIIFQTNRDGNFEIYTLEVANPANQTRITNHTGSDTQPNWSPDGSRIAFTSNRSGNNEVYTANPDATELRNVSNHGADDREPAWSPDGTRLAFSTERHGVGNYEIYLVRPDGTRLVPTFAPIAGTDSQAAWAANTVGPQKLFFNTNRDTGPTSGTFEIYSMNPDGSSQTRLTNNPSAVDINPDSQPVVATTASQGSAQLDDDSDGTLPNSQTIDNIYPRDGYRLTEAIPAGWDLTTATCANGSLPLSVDVRPDETVTCKFTNRKRGALEVIKDTQPNDAQDFTFSFGTPTSFAPPLTPTGFQLDDDGDGTLQDRRTFSNLVPGSGYSTAETVPSTYDAYPSCTSGEQITNITIDPGEQVTCTITNKKRGNIVINKDAFPDETTDFTFTAAGGLTPTSFTLDDDPGSASPTNTRTFSNVVAQNGYTVTEGANVDVIVGVSCDDGASATPSVEDNPNRGATINVDPGETVTCTYVNTGIYPRPGGGTPLRVPLVPAFNACTAPNATHVGPIDKPSCTPPSQESSQLTTSTSGNQLASAKFEVYCNGGAAGEQPPCNTTAGDQEDVRLTTTTSDVRKRSDGSDYTGKVILRSDLRVTDRRNNPLGAGSGTVQDTPFSIPIDCVATPGPNGANCNLTTTLDTLVPNFAREVRRAVISAFSVKLLDAGADGVISPLSGTCPYTCGSGDENTYLQQGVFLP